MRGQYERIVSRLWGKEFWITNNEKYCGKLLKLDPGYESSLHYHLEKDETFHILKGKVELVTNGTIHILGRGATIRIQPGTRHRFKCLSKRSALVLEVSTPHKDEDTIRLEGSRSVNDVGDPSD